MKKVLVAYFSVLGEEGVTGKLAARFAERIHADLFQIEPAQPYTKADCDWRNSKSRSSVEMGDRSSRPAIASQVEDMGQYDVVFVGFPIWWYREPSIIDTFMEAYDFAGKTVVPFATSGGSGWGPTDEALYPSCSPTTVWKPGKMVNRLAGAQMEAWVKQYI